LEVDQRIGLEGQRQQAEKTGAKEGHGSLCTQTWNIYYAWEHNIPFSAGRPKCPVIGQSVHGKHRTRVFIQCLFVCLPLVVVVGLTIDAEQRSLLPTELACDSVLRHFVVNA
jgi:hypothetical protein